MAPNADLVAWTRLKGDYRPEHLQHALEVQPEVAHRPDVGRVFEEGALLLVTQMLDFLVARGVVAIAAGVRAEMADLAGWLQLRPVFT